eukprot:TRINITY_DN1179_c0_g1_i4.p1 TRINITY_DN1179_c0_g1~~TRINITY_DN1179_c0_g1_i4.p1  ORF type:complete len:677 (-),score=107.72 TRINITY_DN1179_c0_g1_i4:300-2240(-)
MAKPHYKNDDVYVTSELRRYPSLTSSDGISGYVIVKTDHYDQHLSYDVKGVDPACQETDHYGYGYGPKYKCGINIREGKKCSYPGKTLYDYASEASDPWLKVHYKSVEYKAKGKAVVKSKVLPHEIGGKVLVMHDSMGDRYACSPLVPVTMLYTPHFDIYPDADPWYCLGGKVTVKTIDNYQILSYELHDIDPGCKEQDWIDDLPENGCGIRIHEGEYCSQIGEPYYDNTHLAKDPWLKVRYYAEGTKAWAKDVPVHTGKSMKDTIHKTLVIYDRHGKPMGCSKLVPVTQIVGLITKPYLLTYTTLSVTGDIVLTGYGGYHVLAYKFHGVDPLCSDPKSAPKYGCTIYIKEGDHCSNVKDPYWDKEDIPKDPYQSAHYYTDRDQSATGEIMLHTGYALADLVYHAAVVYDYNGRPIACATLKPPPGKEPICPKKKAVGPFGRTVVKKTECFPHSSLVDTQEVGQMPLRSLSMGDKVLAQQASGELAYAPTLGFLHVLDSDQVGASIVVVSHEAGEVRATANHLVFVKGVEFAREERQLADVQVADCMLAVKGSLSNCSRVLSVAKAAAVDGLRAPITATGTVVVDGTLASCYADAGGFSWGHGAVHSAFFGLRALLSACSPLLRFNRVPFRADELLARALKFGSSL